MSLSNPFALSPILKRVLRELPDANAPAITIEKLCKQLREDESFVKSCTHALTDLNLVTETSPGKYTLSARGTEYMSLTETEQHIYEKNHPFLHIIDLTNNDSSQKDEST